ncbi:MAG: hypothetical protein K2Z81_10820, partial [Cyanobacteria bacterium]|nr:hypothetical protein [Cyanobacteriota bacterium]
MLPPEHIPDGLSAREYRRLGIQYFLMGHDEKASDAFALGYILETPQSENFCPDETSQVRLSSAASNHGSSLGTNLSNAVTRLM